jgi:hypothetical protein
MDFLLGRGFRTVAPERICTIPRLPDVSHCSRTNQIKLHRYSMTVKSMFCLAQVGLPAFFPHLPNSSEMVSNSLGFATQNQSHSYTTHGPSLVETFPRPIYCDLTTPRRVAASAYWSFSILSQRSSVSISNPSISM